MVLYVERLFSDRFILVRKDTVYPNSAWWENCEFYPSFAYSETFFILRLKLSSQFQRVSIADVIKAMYVTPLPFPPVQVPIQLLL